MPDIKWLGAAENPWGVPVLDVRAVTLESFSVSRDPACAKNAISFFQDDGSSFIDDKPPVQRTIKANLRFRRDRILADGALFIPKRMEHKWAIFFHQGRILCIRSWLRKVFVTTEVEQSGDEILITSLQGSFIDEEQEQSEFSLRTLDYLLQSHALGLTYPAPLPPGMENDPQAAALWCMSSFGCLAQYATPHEVKRCIPETPLRTYSLLHISVARGDKAAIDRCLNSGIPVDLLAGDGLAPMHWALVARPRKWAQIFRWGKDTAMLQHLISRGSPVDIRSIDGATPLMIAVQSGSVKQVNFLIDHGADPNAADARGFTSLHRAAEMGKPDIVKILLTRNASSEVEAQGHTPLSLAAAHNHHNIIKLLKH